VFAYRLCRAPFAVLDGEGARLYGGRWNRRGQAVVYASSSRALAALELLAHVDIGDVPDDLVMLTIEVPDDLAVTVVQSDALPPGWHRRTEHPACQEIGHAWLEARVSAVLRVPSALMPEEFNVLINPRHPDAAGVATRSVVPYRFDPRLLS
jgi:RES domain-containing protein